MVELKIHNLIEDGEHTRAVVRIYEGEVTTEDESVNTDEGPKPVTRFRRTRLLLEKEVRLGQEFEGASQEAIDERMRQELQDFADQYGHEVLTEEYA